MSARFALFRRMTAGACAVLFGVSPLFAQNPALAPVSGQQPAAQPAAQPAGAHPLDPGLARAVESLKHIKENVKDYTATLVKRERVNGTLGNPEYIFTKVRHEPFSVYMYFLKPDDLAGREVIYVHGANNGNMLVHEAKGAARLLGTIELNPTAAIAMRGNRYPITEVGVQNLTKRLIDVAENDRQFGECDVRMEESKINDRQCTMLQVVHPVPRKNFLFHVARVFMDDELKMPIRYESYDWPEKAGGTPILIEEYTYLKMSVNNNLTDEDFSPRNPKYNFRGK
jgi:hypothetical protein